MLRSLPLSQQHVRSVVLDWPECFRSQCLIFLHIAELKIVNSQESCWLLEDWEAA